MRLKKAMACLAAAATLTLVAAVPALAHPHVFVDAQVDIVFDGQGRMKEIREVWRFDPAFSVFATQGLDANGDDKLDAGELKPLAEINVTSLKDFEFFSYLTIGDDRVPLLPPEKYWLEFEAGRLTLFYTLPLKEPAAVGPRTVLEVFDREYFVEFGFAADQPIGLENAPAGCGTRHHRPQELDAEIMSVLSVIPPDQRNLPPDIAQAVSKLANYAAVTCG
jgi:ABC-type uncharacterized transport system substrate-binding protein